MRVKSKVCMNIQKVDERMDKWRCMWMIRRSSKKMSDANGESGKRMDVRMIGRGSMASIGRME